jgi:hypothetical protein
VVEELLNIDGDVLDGVDVEGVEAALAEVGVDDRLGFDRGFGWGIRGGFCW